jgi:hypothetical protein
LAAQLGDETGQSCGQYLLVHFNLYENNGWHILAFFLNKKLTKFNCFIPICAIICVVKISLSISKAFTIK